MSVPLNHKNHRPARLEPKLNIENLSDNNNFKHVAGAILTRDRKTLVGFDDTTQAYHIPRSVEFIRADAFSSKSIKSIKLPSSIKSFSLRSPKYVFFSYKKTTNPHLGEVYEFQPKIVIVNDRRLINELKKIIDAKRIPDFVKSYMLCRVKDLKFPVLDTYGVEYAWGGDKLVKIPKGLKKYSIPVGTTYFDKEFTLEETTIEEITIPDTFRYLPCNLFNSKMLKIIRFSSPQYNYRNKLIVRDELEYIYVPKGSEDSYKDHIDYDEENCRIVGY